MFGTYIGNDQMLVKTIYNGMLKISCHDLSLMPILVSTGAMELPLTKFIMSRVKPGMTVVDVGTNVGYFTVLLGMLVGDQGRVIGFEAGASVFHTLRENLAINWISQRAILHNTAVYSRGGIVTFNSSGLFQGDSSINTRPPRENFEDVIDSIEVEATTLEQALQGVGGIDFLKIDIEGGEYHAFMGMESLFEKRKVKTVAFEWNRVMLGEDADPLIRFLTFLKEGYGVEYFVLNSEGDTVPADLLEITATDFYPFAIMECG